MITKNDAINLIVVAIDSKKDPEIRDSYLNKALSKDGKKLIQIYPVVEAIIAAHLDAATECIQDELNKLFKKD